MHLAEQSGQPFLDLLRWHPRDVDTLLGIYVDRAEQVQEQQRDQRFAQMSEELARRMGRR